MSNTVTLKINDYHKLCSDYIRVFKPKYDKQIQEFKDKHVGKRTYATSYCKPADLEDAVNMVYGHNFGVGTAEERLLLACTLTHAVSVRHTCTRHLQLVQIL